MNSINEKIVFYHANCSDGFSGAWVAWKKFGRKADYIPATHQREVATDLEGKEVYFIDFIYPKETVEKISEKAKKIVAIDHHKTTEESTKSVPDHLYSDDNSGAVLAWKYFYPKQPVPKMLKYVEDMDLWNFKLPNTKEVVAFLDKENFSFERWSELIDMFEKGKEFNNIVSIGKNLLEYKNSIIERICRHSHTVSFEGIEVLAVNSPIFQSEVGHVLYEKKPPMGIIWYENSRETKVSMRSNGDINVRKIAEKYNGGGHKEAASFKIPNHKPLPWKVID